MGGGENNSFNIFFWKGSLDTIFKTRARLGFKKPLGTVGKTLLDKIASQSLEVVQLRKFMSDYRLRGQAGWQKRPKVTLSCRHKVK
jgi:hypothetical protein